MIKKCLLVSLWIMVACVGNAMDISSNDPIEYVDETGELVAGGDARITTDRFIIQADKIAFHKEKMQAVATGNVKIADADIFISADYVSYDVQKDLIHAENSKLKAGERYFSIKSLDIGPEMHTGVDARYFLCDPTRKVTPSFQAGSVELSRAKVLRMKQARAMVGQFTLLYLPKASMKLSDRPFHVEPDFGVNKSHGAYLKNNLYFGLNEKVKIGGLLDLYTKRGLLIGPTLRVDAADEHSRLLSETKFAFIRDQASSNVRGVDIENKPIGRDRYFLDFAHSQSFANGTALISNITKLSDSEIERDFREDWAEKNQRPDSFVELSYAGDNYIASAFTRVEPNTFYETIERIPEFRLEYFPRQVFDTNLVNNAYLDVVRLHGIDKSAMGKAEGNRLDAYYGMSLPIASGDFLVISPTFGVRGLMYGHNPDHKTHTRAIFQGGVDIAMNFTGYSDYINEAFEINGLKHILTPMVQYRIIPSGNMSTGIHQFDTEAFNTEIPSIDLCDMRNIDDLKSQNVVRLGLRNTIQTRSNGYIPRNLVQLDIFQDILFSRHYDRFENSKQKTIQDTHVALELCPDRWVNFNAYGRFDSAKLYLRELRTATLLKDTDFWSLTLCTNYLRMGTERTEQYGLIFAFNLSSQTAIAVEERYDATIRKFSRQRFSISTVLWDSWVADLGITIRGNAKREDKFQFDWHLSLMDF